MRSLRSSGFLRPAKIIFVPCARSGERCGGVGGCRRVSADNNLLPSEKCLRRRRRHRRRRATVRAPGAHMKQAAAASAGAALSARASRPWSPQHLPCRAPRPAAAPARGLSSAEHLRLLLSVTGPWGPADPKVRCIIVVVLGGPNVLRAGSKCSPPQAGGRMGTQAGRQAGSKAGGPARAPPGLFRRRGSNLLGRASASASGTELDGVWARTHRQKSPFPATQHAHARAGARARQDVP